jgi:hypothetical protein
MNNHTRRKHNRIDLNTQKRTAVKNIDQIASKKLITYTEPFGMLQMLNFEKGIFI